jgi:hypothetical protein
MNFLERLRELLRKDSSQRRIKEVSKWDGNASNYTSAGDMARSSLLNFNPVAGRGPDPDNWTKTLVKLPIREEGDPTDVYIDKALVAAAGGRGLQAVTQPEGVSDTDFDKMVRNAAHEIIDGYAQMERVAPQSIYDMAGLPRPEEATKEVPVTKFNEDKKRAMPLYSLWSQALDAVELADMAEETHSFLVDVFADNNQIFAVLIRNGKIFRVDIIIDGEFVTLGEFEEITPDVTEIRAQQYVIRQEDGRYRWLAISATTALNRSGEIDSRDLFDSFVAYIEQTGNYPILNFYHQGEQSRLGVADYVARDDNVYVTSGLYDDTKFGRAAALGVRRNPGYWGNSIEFLAVAEDMLRFSHERNEIDIPVYTKGINTGISILPEKKAAALFTGHATPNRGDNIMREEVKTELTRLFGNADLANEFEDIVDGVNREVDQLIHREADEAATEEVEASIDETEVVETPAPSDAIPASINPETPVRQVEEEILSEAQQLAAVVDTIPVLGRDLLENEDFVGGIAEIATTISMASIAEVREILSNDIANSAQATDELRAAQAESVEQLALANQRIAELEVVIQALQGRFSDMEEEVEEREQQFVDDLSSQRSTVARTHRPRTATTNTARKSNMADTARNTLANIVKNM